MWSREWNARVAMRIKSPNALKTAPSSLRNHILRLDCTFAEGLEKTLDQKVWEFMLYEVEVLHMAKLHIWNGLFNDTSGYKCNQLYIIPTAQVAQSVRRP